MKKEILIACSVLLACSSVYASVAPAPKTMHTSWDLDKDGVNDCEKDGSCDDSVDYSLPRGTDVVSYAENFYKAVNREWLSSHKINPKLGEVSNFTVHGDEINDQLKKIIDSLDKSEKLTSHEQKIIDLYHSFVDVEYRNKLGITPLKKGLDMIAEAKTHEEIAILFAKLASMGVSVPFDTGVMVDKKDSKVHTFGIQQSGITLIRDKYLKKDEKILQEMKYYKELLLGLLILAKQDNVSKKVNDVINIETELAKIQFDSVESRELRKVYNVADFNKLNTIMSNLNMTNFLEIQDVKKDTIFAVEQEKYLKALNKLFVNIDVELWKSYLTAQYIIANGSKTVTGFSDLFFKYNKKLGYVKEQESIVKRGISTVNQQLGMLLADSYIKENFDAKTKQKVKKIIEDIIAQYRKNILSSTLFSQATKDRALKKVEKMTFDIGYPDEWDNYSSLKIDKKDLVGNYNRIIAFHHAKEIEKLNKPVDNTKWMGSLPQTVNAFYSPSSNKFVILAGILNEPFFDINASDAANYGAIGMVIAHEIGHGFDDTGSKYNQDGNLVDWWEAEDRAKYNERAKSLISQADHFEYLPGQHLNGKLEIGEIIGDLNGVTIALAAYETIIKEQRLDRKTSLKEFFIQLAKVWRNKREPHVQEMIVHIDSHPVSEFRVNGVLKNIDTFHEIFETKEGDKMYMAPEKRVKPW